MADYDERIEGANQYTTFRFNEAMDKIKFQEQRIDWLMVEILELTKMVGISPTELTEKVSQTWHGKKEK